jgi:hypothetical protein
VLENAARLAFAGTVEGRLSRAVSNALLDIRDRERQIDGRAWYAGGSEQKTRRLKNVRAS